MTIDDTTIDIHLSKLVGSFFLLLLGRSNLVWLDWLVDRRHSTKDWNERAVAIRAKIQQAILDMPEHPQIKTLLESACEILSFDLDEWQFFESLDLDYFSSLKIVEILKETEKESKNIFGMYSSQRMKVNPFPLLAWFSFLFSRIGKALFPIIRRISSISVSSSQTRGDWSSSLSSWISSDSSTQC